MQNQNGREKEDTNTYIPIVNAAHKNRNTFASVKSLVALNWLYLLAGDRL